MGYLTRYELDVDDDDDLKQQIQKFVEQKQQEDSDFAYGLFYEEAVKWYCWQNDMKVISRNFPNQIITLNGIGEDHGDFWRCYFLNGKYHYVISQITFDSFDESKLKDY